MIFKVIKFLFKIWFIVTIFIIAVIIILAALFKGGSSSSESQEINDFHPEYYDYQPLPPSNDIVYKISLYENNAAARQGAWCECPVCGNFFFKEKIACCSKECEKKYHEDVQKWSTKHVNNRAR